MAWASISPPVSCFGASILARRAGGDTYFVFFNVIFCAEVAASMTTEATALRKAELKIHGTWYTFYLAAESSAGFHERSAVMFQVPGHRHGRMAKTATPNT